MCGIVGYIGHGDTKEIILDGLKSLEYRGYDSSGMALISHGEIIVEKKTGKIQNLADSIKGKVFSSEIGIGHTRWATHGIPSDINSHPHYSMDKSTAVVHNGIIENYQTLRKELEKKDMFLLLTLTQRLFHILFKNITTEIFLILLYKY